MGRGRGAAREGEFIKKFQPPDGGLIRAFTVL